MPQNLSKVYIHCVFSTKKCMPLITDTVRKDLHSYIIGTLSNIGSYVNEIYANPDHLHVLCALPRTITIAELISKIKTSSSKWIKRQGIVNFSWQNGYGSFSVSSSKVMIVEKYILNQPEHHKKVSFKDELRNFFNEYNIKMNNMLGINNLIKGLPVSRQISHVSPLQGFYLNINSIAQGFVTLHPVLLPTGALPLKNLS